MISCIFNLKMQISQNKIHAGIHEKKSSGKKIFGKIYRAYNQNKIAAGTNKIRNIKNESIILW